MQLSQDLPDRPTFTKFSELVDLLVQIMHVTFILWSLKRLYHGNQFLGQIGKTSRLRLHSSWWHSETDENFAMPRGAIEATMIHRFARWRHCCSLLLGRRQHCLAEWATRQALPYIF